MPNTESNPGPMMKLIGKYAMMRLYETTGNLEGNRFGQEDVNDKLHDKLSKAISRAVEFGAEAGITVCALRIKMLLRAYDAKSTGSMEEMSIRIDIEPYLTSQALLMAVYNTMRLETQSVDCDRYCEKCGIRPEFLAEELALLIIGALESCELIEDGSLILKLPDENRRACIGIEHTPIIMKGMGVVDDRVKQPLEVVFDEFEMGIDSKTRKEHGDAKWGNS